MGPADSLPLTWPADFEQIGCWRGQFSLKSKTSHWRSNPLSCREHDQPYWVELRRAKAHITTMFTCDFLKQFHGHTSLTLCCLCCVCLYSHPPSLLPLCLPPSLSLVFTSLSSLLSQAPLCWTSDFPGKSPGCRNLIQTFKSGSPSAKRFSRSCSVSLSEVCMLSCQSLLHCIHLSSICLNAVLPPLCLCGPYTLLSTLIFLESVFNAS